jgi:hypothetical protein
MGQTSQLTAAAVNSFGFRSYHTPCLTHIEDVSFNYVITSNKETVTKWWIRTHYTYEVIILNYIINLIEVITAVVFPSLAKWNVDSSQVKCPRYVLPLLIRTLITKGELGMEIKL